MRRRRSRASVPVRSLGSILRPCGFRPSRSRSGSRCPSRRSCRPSSSCAASSTPSTLRLTAAESAAADEPRADDGRQPVPDRDAGSDEPDPHLCGDAGSGRARPRQGPAGPVRQADRRGARPRGPPRPGAPPDRRAADRLPELANRSRRPGSEVRRRSGDGRQGGQARRRTRGAAARKGCGRQGRRRPLDDAALGGGRAGRLDRGAAD